MPERVQSFAPSAMDGVAEGARQSDVTTAALALANAAPGVRVAPTEALVEALRRVVPGPGAEAHARAVLQVLDDPELKGAVDADGREVRTEAVAALLRLGYPWALQVEPTDLEIFRQQGPAGRGRRRWWWGLLLAALLLGGGSTYWALVGSPLASPEVLSVGNAVVQVTASRSPDPSSTRAVPREWLTVDVNATGQGAGELSLSADTIELVEDVTGRVLASWSRAEFVDQGLQPSPGGFLRSYSVRAGPVSSPFADASLVVRGTLGTGHRVAVRSPLFALTTW